MTEPPQHLLGGLTVALLAESDESQDVANAVCDALEASGVIVSRLSTTARGGLALAGADADAFDAIVLASEGAGLERLQRAESLPALLDRFAAEDKPMAAIGAATALLPGAGDGTHRLTAASAAELEGFLPALKELLAARRRERFATEGDDTPSAVGEDG